ncbi:MAG TPA: hypothetical protein PK331_04420 [Gordonia sp. (in: high G+C Gram-positive bacteria)]|uniref:hypothetical protein n=1 Tax=unclassified Gordonia (in: high G+C Gram-positive bacteria) TaxID=2657482 RepID=UPI000FBA787F|nr:MULTISPECIES: hypothetical protein [unclassified Gordonia (in: high G+C Gram-positive bacteria)]RUP40095.1 MAG: hypothetical protein EKK60_04955 [Gordonia sp. (in: high G+C Gram-positive bacteria)]HNP57214.1 hypothetical protein [Gordonia sp. (in: high G+C Gram-positive bacteria)]HRC50158.1 hypothetical protein [Gordonia sp. (in: high G+C Gram-positive bacteria)]
MIAKPLLAAVTAVATLALGATTAIAPTAHAQEIRHIASNACWSISPNVVDAPYRGRITTTQWLPTERGHLTVYIEHTASIFGYRTRPQLAWHNLTSGARGHVGTTAYSNPLGEGASVSNFWTGPGKVHLTMLTTSNNRVVTVRSTVCSTTVRVY